ncbi:hypothetical protein [Flavobacterium sp.]|uniref:hypothetical protein n=1 Tax=Flavobacterium sp. TaxID=239 RepID=UPI0031D06AD8
MKKVCLFLLISGIILRFIIQFIFPAFNGDEISLGNNIKNSGFVELLYPLDSFQSAPPLYLWIQRFIVQTFPFSFWINIKILSFIFSISGLVLFYVFIKRNKFNPIFLLLFIVLIFNPFIVNNSLTVKQYTIDLTGSICLLVYFQSEKFKKYNWIFFLIWSLMSNIGLFACCGYLIYNLFKSNSFNNFGLFLKFIKNNILTILVPIPYVVYFLWFMKQKGAAELKSYMVQYWSDTFIPLNSSIFKYLIFTIHGLWTSIFNAFEIWGVFMMLLIVPFFIFYRKQSLFKEEILLLFCVVLVHLILNVFQMYPFSDRLYLYIAPFFILILGSSLNTLSGFAIIKKHFQKIYIVISISTLFLYVLYMPSNDNNVYLLYKKLNNLEANQVYVTGKSLETINSFDKFTDNKFTTSKKILLLDTELDKSSYVVSRVSKKLKFNSTSPPESEIQNLIKSNRIKRIDWVNGYYIYEIKNK